MKQNRKVKELLQLSQHEFNEYLSLFELVKPVNKLGKYKCKSLLEMTYGGVIELINKASNDDWIGVIKCYFPNLSDRQILNFRAKDFLPLFYWIKSDLKVYEKRQKLLEGVRDPLLEQAGIERLEVIGQMHSVLSIAKSWGFRLDELQKLEDLPYSLVFTALYDDKLTNDIQHDYQELMKQKNK